jgi:hypothetical protein
MAARFGWLVDDVPVVSLDKRQLEGAPAYDVGDELAWGDRAYESKVGLIGVCNRSFSTASAGFSCS